MRIARLSRYGACRLQLRLGRFRFAPSAVAQQTSAKAAHLVRQVEPQLSSNRAAPKERLRSLERQSAQSAEDNVLVLGHEGEEWERRASVVLGVPLTREPSNCASYLGMIGCGPSIQESGPAKPLST
jgi:hypothetical protein